MENNTVVKSELARNKNTPNVRYYELSDGEVMCVALTASGSVSGIGRTRFLAALAVYRAVN